MKPGLVVDCQCVIGEGSLWHPSEKRVYWTDIPEGRIFRYDPATGQHEQCYEGEVVGGFTIQADGALLLFMTRGAVKIWRAGKLTTMIAEIPHEVGSRFNDVIADPAGRVFCGMMPDGERACSLYRLDTDGRLTRLRDGIGCSNGMGFTPDRRQFYYTDSAKREIYRFDYDVGSGDLTNRRLFVRTPDGKEERRIPFPAKKVSSVAFGGDDLVDMCVTTAGGDQRITEGTGAGALFRLRPGIRGLPEFYSRVGL
jgi:D-xylonolactonase